MTRTLPMLLAAALVLPLSARAQDPEPPGEPPSAPTLTPYEGSAPSIRGAQRVTMNWTNVPIGDLVQWFADVADVNFILEDPNNLRDTVTIISHGTVTANQALEAFLQALDMKGYTIVEESGFYRLVKSPEAAQAPTVVGRGEVPEAGAHYVTQIIQLDNVSVGDVQSVVQSLSGPNAKLIVYQPANTLIITDTATNLRKIYRILNELDIAAPRSRLEIIPIVYAEAAEVAQLIEELYGTGQEAQQQEELSPRARARARRRRRRAQRDEPAQTDESVTAGEEATFISKVMSDERTNSLIVLANEEGMEKIKELIAQIDVDVDLSSRAQIHVVYLEHAKAEDVAQVLANLSEESQQEDPRRARAARARQTDEAEEEGGGGVTAAFDSGMRITHDENTNSLVIISSQDDFRVVKQVIDMLDVRRRQVFVDAVILELSSDDSLNFGVAYHSPYQTGPESSAFLGGQFGANSLGLSQDLLSGLALGVFGETVAVPFAGATGVESLQVPAFGIVLHALKSNSSVNIVSNPNLLTLDNEEARIVVGKKIPFPTTSGLNNLGQPVVSFQREDVAITLQMTPRINSSNYVTLELVVEVQEIEEDDSGLNVNQAGFITSKREVESTVLVRDNQTVVLGGLMSSTDTDVETKVPILGDLPLIGALFRGSRDSSRKTNLMLFLTPHIIDDEADMVEVMTVKEAQRQEFLRRFYGRSRDQQLEEIRQLMAYSMNYVDEPSMYRGPEVVEEDLYLDEEPISDETRRAIGEELEDARIDEPGEGAGDLPEEGDVRIVVPEEGGE